MAEGEMAARRPWAGFSIGRPAGDWSEDAPAVVLTAEERRLRRSLIRSLRHRKDELVAKMAPRSSPGW